MKPEVKQLIDAAQTVVSILKRDDVSFDTKNDVATGACVQAFDGLENALSAVRGALQMPSFVPLYDKGVAIEAMYWCVGVLDQFTLSHDEVFADLLDTLENKGSAGVAKSITQQIAHDIRAARWNGLLARVSCPDGSFGDYVGVIAVQTFEELVPAAVVWAAATRQNAMEAAA